MKLAKAEVYLSQNRALKVLFILLLMFAAFTLGYLLANHNALEITTWAPAPNWGHYTPGKLT